MLKKNWNNYFKEENVPKANAFRIIQRYEMRLSAGNKKVLTESHKNEMIIVKRPKIIIYFRFYALVRGG